MAVVFVFRADLAATRNMHVRQIASSECRSGRKMVKLIKKKIQKLFSAVLLLAAFHVHAQVGVDPDDYFYTLVESWENRGLLREVPPLRPYSLASIQNILQNVIKRGSKHDVDLAIEYWQKLMGKAWYVTADTQGDAGFVVAGTEDTYEDGDSLYHKYPVMVSTNPPIAGDMLLYKDCISMCYRLGLNIRSEESDAWFLPRMENSPHDARQDAASLGPLYGYIDVNDVISIGHSDLFLQAGIYRSGYGPFRDAGLALNDSAYHAANLSFSIVKKKWSYAQQYSAIGATYSYDGSNLAPGKFLAFHAIEYKFLPNLSLSYYETMVYGNRFDLSYLLPVPYMAAQGIGGNADNLQMGLLLKFRPYKGLLLAADIFVDDIDVNKMVKDFSFKSKNRIAMQLGAAYTPESAIMNKMEIRMAAVLPYTYTHWEYATAGALSGTAGMTPQMYNYQDYTNNGIPMGSTLPPNSLAVFTSVELTPAKNFHLKIGTTLVSHGNLAESLTEEEALLYLLSENGMYATDGSIRMHSMFGDPYRDVHDGGTHVESAWNSLNFLNQEHKLLLIQTSVDADYTFPSFGVGTLALNAGYTFEYIGNMGVDSNIYPGGRVVSLGNNLYAIDGSGSYTGTDVVTHFQNEWKNRMIDHIIKNYLTLGVRFTF